MFSLAIIVSCSSGAVMPQLTALNGARSVAGLSFTGTAHASETAGGQANIKAEKLDSAPPEALPGPVIKTPDARESAPLHFDQQQYSPWPALPAGMQVFYRGNAKRKVVALTFDDGPRPEQLSQLLAILEHYHVKATFFFTGVQVEKFPRWARMAAQAGHEIGNHTYDHLRLPKIPDVDKGPEIERAERLIWNVTGQHPQFVRPPGGELDQATRDAITKRGLAVAMYDVNLRDDTPGIGSRALLRSGLARVRPGSVVLGHSSVEATIAMLPQFIVALKARGYRFATISELAAAK